MEEAAGTALYTIAYLMSNAGAIAEGAGVVAGVAGGVAETYSAFNQPKMPGVTSQTQTDMEAEKEKAAQAQAEALLRRRGMASTILTSPLGIQSGSPTMKATLGA
jgi:hypothetical protein